MPDIADMEAWGTVLVDLNGFSDTRLVPSVDRNNELCSLPVDGLVLMV